jgi:hypothetical protein
VKQLEQGFLVEGQGSFYTIITFAAGGPVLLFNSEPSLDYGPF